MFGPRGPKGIPGEDGGTGQTGPLGEDGLSGIPVNLVMGSSFLINNHFRENKV